MKFKNGLILSAIAGFMMLAYNNCSGVGFSSDSASSSVVKTGDPNPGGNPPGGNPPGGNPPIANPDPGPDPRVPQIVKNCNDAASAGTIKSLNQTIKFDDTKVETGRNQVCDFGIGDNLPVRDGYMQARYEQSRTLQLPANAVICNVQMTVAQQKFRYDDILFLTYNGRILGTDNKSALQSKLSPESSAQLSNGKLVPIYKYDWLALRGAGFVNVADDYCLGADQGGGNCAWPVTEQTGNIVFQFNPELLIAIGLKAPATQQTFGFIMTGDNDLSLDCYHEALQFDMNVTYYLQ